MNALGILTIVVSVATVIVYVAVRVGPVASRPLAQPVQLAPAPDPVPAQVVEHHHVHVHVIQPSTPVQPAARLSDTPTRRQIEGTP